MTQQFDGIDIAHAQTNENKAIATFSNYIKKVDVYECSRNC
ncbi:MULTISPECIES: hypothetical protein [Acinetobacter]|jgi:hypothetical protein|nr:MULTISPECIES: hypothetical protein [Acinetobacter]